MIAPARQYSSVMSFSPSQASPPKRPRLQLQIKTPGTAQSFGKSSTALKGDVNPTSPTAFNTLSNAYAAAIENASPRTARPPSGTSSTFEPKKPTSLRLETTVVARSDEYIHPSQRTQTPGPFAIQYPDTPSSAFPDSTPTTAHPDKPVTSAIVTSATTPFTFTPPQSAGSDKPMARVFTFAANTNTGVPMSPRTPRRRVQLSIQGQAAPYTHPRALHSILRNSPLPPRTNPTPATPSRMSMRLANRTNKKVGYNDPLTQTITTNKYVKSHIDLLAEDSPFSATFSEKEKSETLDITMAYTGDETRDGGETPGPFEEMRRRMAESDLETPGTRKRKRREKKRKWEWTITTPEDAEGEGARPTKTPLTALRVERTPATAIWRGNSVSSESDTEAETENFRQVSVDLDSEMSDDLPHSALQDTRDSIEHSVEREEEPQL